MSRGLVVSLFAFGLAACARHSPAPGAGPNAPDDPSAGTPGAGASSGGGEVDDGSDAGVAAPGDPGGGSTGSSEDPGDIWIVASAGSAATPPMGWNSWNLFACNVNQTVVRGIADALVGSGMKAAGYSYVNVDDCWADHRDAAGNMVASATAFPDGMQTLAGYIHAQGLKAGIYTAVGDSTCAGRPGSHGYAAQDARSYALWGYDYVKVDQCGTVDNPGATWGEWTTAIAATSRPMVYSVCSAGRLDPWNWAPPISQLYRTTDDINTGWSWILSIIDQNQRLASLAAPGHWNDPDMLEVGNGDLTEEQNRTHFSLWAMMAAPLIAGNDLRSMSETTRSILTNAELIAVDQDRLGYQGYRVSRSGSQDVWVKPLASSDGSAVRAVALVNNDTASAAQLAIPWDLIGIADGKATLRDLWAHQDLGTFDTTAGSYTTTLPPSGTVVLRVVGRPPALPHGDVALSELRWTYGASYWGPVERDRSNGEEAPADGRPLSIAGKQYAKGLGTHAGSLVRYRLGGRCTGLTGTVGVDDEVGAGNGSVTFEVWADGKRLFQSSVLHQGTAAPFSVDLTGINELKLLTTNAQDGFTYDHADWADLQLTCAP